MSWYNTLQEAMNAERSEYLKAHIYEEQTDEPGVLFGSAPRQFNVQLGTDGDNTYYKVEFMEHSQHFIDATTWASDEEATKIFIECDATKIDLSAFEDEWMTQL